VDKKMKRETNYDEMAKAVIQRLVEKELHRNDSDLDMLREFARGFERANPEASLIPESLIRELVEVQRDTKLFIRDIVRVAARRLLDKEMSDEDEKCVYVDGKKWPWPLPECCRI